MSWILKAFRVKLATEKEPLESLVKQGEVYQAFSLANSIAHSTGRNFNVEMSLNYPAGQSLPKDVALFGNSNVGIIVEKGRKRFERVTAEMVQVHAAEIGEGVRFESAGHGYEGFHVITREGRITVLPGSIYIWLPIDERVERFLNWLFVNAYGLVPPAG